MVGLLDRREGLPLFELSRKLAVQSVYKYTRNPMSLVFYFDLHRSGNSWKIIFFTLWVFLVLIPAHIAFLKYFEDTNWRSGLDNLTANTKRTYRI